MCRGGGGRTLIIRISNRTSRSGTTELSLYLTKAEHFTLFSLPNFNFTPEVLDILKQFKDSVVVKTSFGIGIWFKILFRNNFHRIHFRDGTLATRKKYTFVPLFLRVYTCGGHEGLLPKSSCFLKEKNNYMFPNLGSFLCFQYWKILSGFFCIHLTCLPASSWSASWWIWSLFWEH